MGGLMVSVLNSIVVYHVFKPRSYQRQ